MLQSEFDRALTSLLPDGVEEKRFLLAVSGGIDSMCMAYLFLHSPLNLDFAVANVNFKLREGDCDLDQELVKSWCESNSVMFHTIDFDTKAYAKGHCISTQMAARDLRYNWFYDLADNHNYDYIAVAHNLDDSVETLFINLLRGTGIKGLAGIRDVNGKIIRPMLNITRGAIVEYVAQHRIEYRDDKTNFESHYSRNRLRNIVFPEFRNINPSFLQTVKRSSAYFTQAEELLDDLYESYRGTLYSEEGDVLYVDIDKLVKEKHKGYWLYRILSQRGFNASQQEDIENIMCGQSGKRILSATHELIVDRGCLKIYPLRQISDNEIIIDSPGEYLFNGVAFKLDFHIKDEDFDYQTKPGQLFFSADTISFPIICRGWRSGDRFRPLGMTGFKKLSDFFKDLKMDKRGKESQPVLVDKENIVCLPGLRIDDRYKIKTSTKIVAEVNILN